MVHMYLFLLNPYSKNFIQRSRELVLQNQWAYDQITKAVPTKKITIMGRSNPKAIFGLPKLSEVCNTLDVLAEPPVFVRKPRKISMEYYKMIFSSISMGNSALLFNIM